MKLSKEFILSRIGAIVCAFGISASASALVSNSSYRIDRWECPGTVKCKTKDGLVKYPVMGIGETERRAQDDCLEKLIAWGKPTCVGPGHYSLNLCKKVSF